MKRLFIVMSLFAASLGCYAQTYDPVAVSILDRMSEIIGDLSSVKYSVSTSRDLVDFDFGQTTSYNTHEVYMTGPDKMLVNSNGDNGHKEYWYNGTKICYYNFDENNYAEMETPPTIIETIDTINKLYGIDFPAADFFYPTFTDDLMSMSDKINFGGIKLQQGKDCFHIIADSKEMTLQFWISNDATMMPKRMVINYKNKKDVLRYEALFTEWQLNPVLPLSMFDFLIPAGASVVRLVPKSK